MYSTLRILICGEGVKVTERTGAEAEPAGMENGRGEGRASVAARSCYGFYFGGCFFKGCMRQAGGLEGDV